MRIIPMPKRLYEDAGRICVGGELRVCCPDGMMPRLEVLLGLMLHGVKVSFRSSAQTFPRGTCIRTTFSPYPCQ